MTQTICMNHTESNRSATDNTNHVWKSCMEPISPNKLQVNGTSVSEWIESHGYAAVNSENTIFMKEKGGRPPS